MQRTRRVFISHSWKDKPLARRVARRLSRRGVAVWIDEAEMQIGDRLSDRLADEIRHSSHIFVVVTEHAVASKWVRQEIAVAQATGGDVVLVPLVADKCPSDDLLGQSLGVDITDPLTFEECMDALSRAVSACTGPGPADVEGARADLRAIAHEVTEIGGLLLQLADEGGATLAQIEATVLTEEMRHPAETALITLYETAASDEARYVIALVAASFYRRLGVGYAVLRRHLEVEAAGSDSLGTMFQHLGHHVARTEDLDGAFRLFERAMPRQDQAFAAFVRANFDRFSAADRARAVRLVVTPDRGPAPFVADAAYELLIRLPDDDALHSLWFFWVLQDKFGAKHGVVDSQPPGFFFIAMNQAVEAGATAFEPIMEAFESRFRTIARAGRVDEVLRAVSILQDASQTRYVGRTKLATQLANAVGSAEWNVEALRPLSGPVLDIAQAARSDHALAPGLEALTRAISRGPR